MEFKEVTVKEGPGLCRCCLSVGCYKDLSTEYSWMGDSEIYADMLLDCFDISISQHSDGPNGLSRLICEVCITRLRDACNFKKQVLASEKNFIDMISRGAFKSKVVVFEDPVEVKIDVEPLRGKEEPLQGIDEPEGDFLEEETVFVNDELEKEVDTDIHLSEDITVATLPVKGKRGRPRKSTVDKPTKKMKLSKTDKPKTSKMVTIAVTSEQENKPKLKRKFISLKQKLDILDQLDSGKKLIDIVKDVDLNESTIRTIKQNESKIRSAARSRSLQTLNRYARVNDSLIPKMESCLKVWIKNCNRNNIPLNSYLIRDKAQRIFTRLTETDSSVKPMRFVSSKGWFNRFRRRFLQNIEIKEGTNCGHKVKEEVLDSDDLNPQEQVCDADEIGLYWKKMPKRTYSLK